MRDYKSNSVKFDLTILVLKNDQVNSDKKLIRTQKWIKFDQSEFVRGVKLYF